MHNKDKRLSVIIPMHNESGNIEELHKRLIKVQQSFANPFEMIFINDGSTDSTLDMLKVLARLDKNIKIIDLSRNFGHQIAIRAGLSFVTADAAVIMDADLQDPPELIKTMVDKWEEGYQVIYAIRKKRKEGILLRFLYAAFYRLLKIMSNTSIPLDAGDFCLLDKSIVKILSEMPETDPFIRGLRSWAGYRQVGVEYDRQERFVGKAKYTFLRLFKLALDGIVSFSDIPLKIVVITGFIVSFFSFLLIVALFMKRLPISGTTTIAVLILFLGGVQLVSIGILGEYIGRIYEQSKRRPLFLVKETVNI